MDFIVVATEGGFESLFCQLILDTIRPLPSLELTGYLPVEQSCIGTDDSLVDVEITRVLENDPEYLRPAIGWLVSDDLWKMQRSSLLLLELFDGQLEEERVRVPEPVTMFLH